MSTEKNALVVIADGVEEVEAVTPIDLLRRAGVRVTVASASGSLLVRGRNAIEIKADTLLRDHPEMEVDLLVIPGGPGHQTLANDEGVLDLVRAQDASNKLIGSLCAGPVVLKAAGILEGRRYTSFPATRETLPERIPDQSVVVDRNLVTSQAAGTAYPFALQLVESLLGPQARKEIAESTCFAG
jgi:4-methyl-5(b-hydroxyethyl)-thiazole monophosphate biosynthesis